MKCFFCKDKDAVLVWKVFLVCQDCFEQQAKIGKDKNKLFDTSKGVRE